MELESFDLRQYATMKTLKQIFSNAIKNIEQCTKNLNPFVCKLLFGFTSIFIETKPFHWINTVCTVSMDNPSDLVV